MTMRPDEAKARLEVCRAITLRYLTSAVAANPDGLYHVPAAKVPCSRRWLIGEGAAGVTADNTPWQAERVRAAWIVRIGRRGEPRPTAAGDRAP